MSDGHASKDEIPEIEFRRATAEEFQRAFDQVEKALAERPRLTEAERETGWEEDPWSGLRMNKITGEIDDSLFVHRSTR